MQWTRASGNAGGRVRLDLTGAATLVRPLDSCSLFWLVHGATLGIRWSEWREPEPTGASTQASTGSGGIDSSRSCAQVDQTLDHAYIRPSSVDGYISASAGVKAVSLESSSAR